MTQKQTPPSLPIAASSTQLVSVWKSRCVPAKPRSVLSAPAFLCMQSARSPLTGPWQGFLCLSCQYGLIQCHCLPKANHEGTVGRPVTICPSEVLATSVQPSSLQPQCSHVDWPLWSLKAVLPRGRSSKAVARKDVPGGLAEPLEREESGGHRKKGSPSPCNQPWVFHLQEGVVRGAGTLGCEVAVARVA